MPRQEYKDRQFNLILPTASDLEKWRAAAAESQVSLNMYIFEMVERALKRPVASPAPSKDLQAAREELFKTKEELRLKTMMLEKKEEELFKLQHRGVLLSKGQDSFAELLDRLKTGGTWSTDELIRAQGLDPKDSEIMAIIYQQLTLLQKAGLVAEESRGWRWKQ